VKRQKQKANGSRKLMTTDIDVAEVLRLERELQTAECRRDRTRVGALLAEDFIEVGVSGRVWDRASVLELLGAGSGDDDLIEVHDLTGRVIGDGVVMACWDSERRGRRARRTSLWRRDPAGWRLVHHQGTLLPESAAGGNWLDEASLKPGGMHVHSPRGDPEGRHLAP
jgi:hypothetical protein